MKEDDEQEAPTEAPKRRVARVLPASPRKWMIAVVTVLVLLVAYLALLNRFTPLTGECFVQAFVTQVSPQVPGVVTAVHVGENQEVKKGELLFELDARPYEFAVKKLKAELVLAKRDVRVLESDLEDAEQVLASTRAGLELRKKEYEEFVQAAESEAVAKRNLFQAEARLRESEAGARKAEADRAKAAEGLGALLGEDNALVAKAEALLAKAEYDLAQTKVFAASNGYVSNVQLTAGTYVDAGTAVMTVIDSDDWWTVASFPENTLPLMDVGKPARVAFGSVPGRLFEGRVESIGWGVAEGQGVPSGMLLDVEGPTDWVRNSQRFPVRVRLDDPGAAGDLRVGATATVLIYSSDNGLLNGLGSVWIRLASLLNFLS